MKFRQKPTKSEKHVVSQTSCIEEPEEMEIEIDEMSQENDTDWSTYEEYDESIDDSDDCSGNDDVGETKSTVR